MQKRAWRVLALSVALACAATAHTASAHSKQKTKPVRGQAAAPAIPSGAARPSPPPGPDTVKLDTVTTYRNALDQTVYAIKATHFDISPALKDVPSSPQAEGTREENEPPNNPRLPPFRQIRSDVPDPVVQSAPAPSQLLTGGVPVAGPVSAFSFDGISRLNYTPPDNNGSVGTDQYVETVNARLQVWSLNRPLHVATSVFGPVAINVLWSGFGAPCQTQNSGDPIVVFDKVAGRWLISQLTISPLNGTYHQCVALSTTANAAGTYYRWAFAVPHNVFNDYPHFGVWPDAYVMMAHGFVSTTGGYVAALFAAMDRAKMLAGDPTATWQVIEDPIEAGHMPADLDGYAPPPTGAAPIFLSVHGDRMFIYRMKVDFATPANTARTLEAAVPIAPWTGACGGGGTCIPQPGGDLPVDSLGDRLMFRAAYRNFIDHESVVVSHSVDPSVPGVASGVRWYDIRLSGPPDAACPAYPCLYQQGTIADAPDGRSRWMSSLAMDAAENILVGYSVTGKFAGIENHSIRYTGRAKDDPLGTMTVPEFSVATGVANDFSNRWGDYTSMSVDPVDDCTFWYVNQYFTAADQWRTWIVSSAWPSGSLPGQCPAAACIRPSAVPTGVAATPSGDNRIDLSWTGIAPSPGSYAIERAEGACGSEGPYRPLAAVNGAASGVVDTSVQGGITYSYRVIAASDAKGRCQALAASPCASAAASGRCDRAPSFAGAIAATSLDAATCGIKVSWVSATSSCPLTPEVRYSVFRGTTPDFVLSPANRIATCIAGPSWYVDTDNLTSGATYFYVVRAEDGSTGNGGACGGNAESNDALVSATPYGSGTQAAPGLWTDAGGDGTGLLHLDVGVGLGATPTWRFVRTTDDAGANHTPGGTYAYRNAGPGPAATYSPSTCADITTPPLVTTGPVMNLRYWERHQLEYAWDGVAVEYAVNDDGDWLDMPDPSNAARFGCTGSDATTDFRPLSCTESSFNGCGFSDTKRAITGPYAGGSSCGDYVPSGPLTSYVHRCHQIDDLPPGATIRFRWRFASDTNIERAGFYLDDVSVTNVALPNACTPDPCGGSQAATGEVAELSVLGATSTTLAWTGDPAAVAYDLVSSTLSDLRQSGTATGSCLANDVAGLSRLDIRPDPPPGDGYYYLVRAQDACGRGTYGSDSAGAPRLPSPACP